MKKLTSNFLNELFKICLKKKNILQLASEHIKFNFLPSEHYKEIWNSMTKYYETSEKLLSVGLLSQQFANNAEVVKVIHAISIAETPDPDSIVDQLEEFIKQKMFIEAYDQLGTLFNEGKKDEAFELMNEIADQLSGFKLRDDASYSRIIADIINRTRNRRESASDKLIEVSKKKIPTGIAPIDNILRGGIDRGDTFLAMAGSGIGKSKLLKQMGVSSSRLGFRVVHIQGEGTLSEAEELYDTAIIGKDLRDIEMGNLTNDEISKLEGVVDNISSQGGEIHIKAFEQFDTATFRDIRDYVEEITERFGPVDLLLVDYLELFDPGDGKRYSTSNEGERKRRESSANNFKNICVEFDIAGASATQSNTPPIEQTNDPSFVLTRYNISEFKGLIKPFSYFVTLNVTPTEIKEKRMRLYIDKIRKYPCNDRIINICTNYSRERFYDHKNTVKRFPYE